ncbi:pyranose dehydrogenase [Ephemerocybe angulata]|uniref:pyranose dehydrogenase (acceptor) n=1 Tax=Ephemerocybe angulata TaxID=980116 RepID=A0A8H6I1G6_9AGAR|nr:pyranose dehydrogenase [Tulosesus angulatus]
MILGLFTTITAIAGSTHGKVFQHLSELPLDLMTFDFIVSGGGTGGSVIASRLSENKAFNVLLIEAGPDTADQLGLSIPGWGLGKGTENPSQFIWNYESVPQEGWNGRKAGIPRGRGLGGSSAVNGMVYTRGSKDDYDNWARVTGDPGWSWNALRPYIRRSERWTPPAGGRNATGEYDPAVHGYMGRVETSLPWDGHLEHDIRTIRNAEIQKAEFPLVLDGNAGRSIGVTWMQSTIGNGTRSSAATAYLGDPVRKRGNLAILLNTQVLRVHPVVSSVRRLDIRTVEVISSDGGTAVKFTAKKELVLSGGVIGTPHILLNSGIGNRTELESLGVASILDLPDIGKGITEHVAANLVWDTVPLNTTTIDQDLAYAMWQQNRTGPLTATFTHQILWSKIPSSSTLFKEWKDPSTGTTSPHLELPLDAAQNAYLALLTPYSRGSLRLASSNPLLPPLIDLGLLTHPFDMAAIKEGVRIMKRFYSGPAWEGYITGFRGPDPDVLSNEEFEKRIRDNAITFYHPVGGSAMSKRGEKRGVVDGELKVKGVRGLRIVDASVFPYVLTAHTQAPVYILAERAADLILTSWGG